MAVDAEIRATREELAWIDQALGDGDIKTSDGSHVPQKVWGAAACFHQSIEHAMAIERLCSEPPHCGSAFALLRPLFESMVRGLWLLHSATARQAQNFLEKDRLNFTIGELIKRVERDHIAFAGGTLSQFKDGAWKSFCGFVHTGADQVARRIKPVKSRPIAQMPKLQMHCSPRASSLSSPHSK